MDVTDSSHISRVCKGSMSVCGFGRYRAAMPTEMAVHSLNYLPATSSSAILPGANQFGWLKRSDRRWSASLQRVASIMPAVLRSTPGSASSAANFAICLSSKYGRFQFRVSLLMFDGFDIDSRLLPPAPDARGWRCIGDQ